MKIPKIIKAIIAFVLVATIAIFAFSACGAQGMFSWLQGYKSSLIGSSYTISTYDHYGVMDARITGQRIDMDANYVASADGSSEMSSVITFTIDGKEMEACGDTIIIAEKGLEPVDFEMAQNINSYFSNDPTDLPILAKVINQYKNFFGKSRVVVIKSQLGIPICAFSGEDVYWEVADELPKSTKLMIDGKALYIHRANFKIIDMDLLA